MSRGKMDPRMPKLLLDEAPFPLRGRSSAGASGQVLDALGRQVHELGIGSVQVDLGETFGNRFLLAWHPRGRDFSDVEYLSFWQALARVVCSHGPRVDDTLHLFPHRRGASADFWVVGGDGRPATHCANGLMYAGQRWHDCWGARRVALFCGQQARRVMVLGGTACVNLGRPQPLPPCPVEVPQLLCTPFLVDTGEPHAVSFGGDLAIAEYPFHNRFREIGRELCRLWTPGGINWNLVRPTAAGLRIRTFERAVRRPTRSCGTGSAAAFYAARSLGLWTRREAAVISRGGTHLVRIEREELLITGRPQHERTVCLAEMVDGLAVR
jgi:diaminopimelate epimerase